MFKRIAVMANLLKARLDEEIAMASWLEDA